MTTLLALDTVHIAPKSWRGITQSIEPIEQAKATRRDINGGGHDDSLPQFQKYRSTLSCTDMNSLSFDKTWPGKTVVVDCIAELSYKTAGGSPGRTVVTGSSRVEGDTTFYRPRLTMLITNWDVQDDEYGAAQSWTLEFEEV